MVVARDRNTVVTLTCLSCLRYKREPMKIHALNHVIGAGKARTLCGREISVPPLKFILESDHNRTVWIFIRPTGYYETCKTCRKSAMAEIARK